MHQFKTRHFQPVCCKMKNQNQNVVPYNQFDLKSLNLEGPDLMPWLHRHSIHHKLAANM